MNPKIVAKLSSVTAICLLAMIGVLCTMTFQDGSTWKETFSATLGALLGYYIGRNRTNEEQPK